MQIPHIDKNSKDGDDNYKAPTSFPIGPRFTRYEGNPILTPNKKRDFESAYIYNAAAIVVDDKVFLLYRAQNTQKTSSIGIAWSEDGYNFIRYHKPVIAPTEPWEKGGGCEDPRIVRDPKTKLFVVTYSAYDTVTSRLCLATSENLFEWKKQPPFISFDTIWNKMTKDEQAKQLKSATWLKSGAIFTERYKDGYFYMIWGDSSFFLARSHDLLTWEVAADTQEETKFTSGIFPWQNRLIEPGPAPIKLDNGDTGNNYYVLFYNSATNGTEELENGTYTISEMLIDYDNLNSPLSRLEIPIITPTLKNETFGQVNNVVFTEGLVQFHGKWFLYFGQSDSELGVAICSV